MTLGLVLASPVIIYQVWAFLSPALHRHEKRVGIGVLAAGLVLFLSGAALAFFVVIPPALPWLMGFAPPSLRPLITAEDYFGFVLAMVLTFGVSFELPIVVLALSALGIVTRSCSSSSSARSSRRVTWCTRRSCSPCRCTPSTN